MVKEFEIQGRICNLPVEMTEEEFWYKTIGFIEENGWSFGGGLEKEKISGCISETSPNMTRDEFEKIFLGFVEQNGWSFEGSIQKYSFADMLNDLEIRHEIEFQYNGTQYAITNNMDGEWCFFADGKDYLLCRFEETDILLNKVKNLSIQGKSLACIIDQQLYDPDTLCIF